MDDVSLSVSLTFEYVFNLYIYCYVSPVLRFLEAIKMRATCVHELQNKKFVGTFLVYRVKNTFNTHV